MEVSLEKTLKQELPHDSTPEHVSGKDESLIQKDTCTSTFIAALSTIPKTWKQPKHASTGEWLKRCAINIYMYMCVYMYIPFYPLYIKWITQSQKE